jgi:hypothetical protein
MATDRPARSSERRDVDWNDYVDNGPSSTPRPDVEPCDGTTPIPPRPFLSAAADEIALAALRERRQEHECCDLCDAPLPSASAPLEESSQSAGLYMWSRGDERRFEEPPICASCASSIGVSAWVRWTQGEDDGE